MNDKVDGVVSVYKPKGLTSHDIIDEIRRHYHLNAGHAGTLDPMAQGVLVVFLGKALKLLSYLPPVSLDKVYLLRITLGVTTDTYDATGKALQIHNGNVDFSNEEILQALKTFIGEIDQCPPAFSAVKIAGKRAYNLARSGETPEIPARKVHIHSIKLLKDYVSGEHRNLLLRMHCGRGTYVRSVAHDLGQKLGCGGHLSYLLRERVGIFTSQNSFPLWKIKQELPFINEKAFLKSSEILPFPTFIVKKELEIDIQKGKQLAFADLKSAASNTDDVFAANSDDPKFQIVSEDGRLLAIYKPEIPKQQIQSAFHAKLNPARVFLQE
ncbi:MAG: tRNA pseudouridine(55) synthase TruB [Candidatus Riflebacteria bacterium]|nr:tRNA pseudouridine(55) synthase TruB [Candidatus Riflebacteria bacterium]